MSYFSKFHSVEFIKKEYRKLCMANHPDRGGDLEAMKVINVEYKEALQRVNGQTTYDNNGGEHKYYYNEDVEQALIEKIYELLGLNMSNVEKGRTKSCNIADILLNVQRLFQVFECRVIVATRIINLRNIIKRRAFA